MVEHRIVLSPWTATTLPAKTALFSWSNTSRRSASILIGSLPPPPRAPRGEAAFLGGPGEGRRDEGKAEGACEQAEREAGPREAVQEGSRHGRPSAGSAAEVTMRAARAAPRGAPVLSPL